MYFRPFTIRVSCNSICNWEGGHTLNHESGKKKTTPHSLLLVEFSWKKAALRSQAAKIWLFVKQKKEENEKNTPPKFNIAFWKMMVGRRSFPFGAR